MLTRFITNAVSLLYGKKKYQKLFEWLNQISLKGMHVGSGSDVKDSGEKETLGYVKNKLKHYHELVIFDVGANVGHYSDLLIEIFGSGLNLHAFEPSLQTFKLLTSNIQPTSKIHVYNFGLGAEKSQTILYHNSNESGLASIYKRRLDHINISVSNETEKIELRTLDAFCEERNIRQIHFLKLDVEGNELNVLKGAQKMLGSRSIDFIQFEFGGCNIDSRTYFQDFYYLLSHNYIIYRILKDGLFKIDIYKESYELFSTTNYLAELK